MTLCDEVRRSCAEIAGRARAVRIDVEALERVEPAPPPALDPERHYLEGSRVDVASYVLTLDAINFGSGWFPVLRKRPGCSGYFTVAWALADRFRAEGPWTSVDLRAMRIETIADVLGQPRDLELMALYAQALRELGRFLGARTALDLIDAAGGSAPRLAGTLGRGMTMWADRGFYKRAQIAVHDLALAGVASLADLDELTIFADNLVPHVLRCDGVLTYDDPLAAHIDAGRPLPVGPWEREIRACAVQACEVLAERVGTPPRLLDNWLWNRGQAARYKARPRHRCRCIAY
jgi:putative queuosine salvage protein